MIACVKAPFISDKALNYHVHLSLSLSLPTTLTYTPPQHTSDLYWEQHYTTSHLDTPYLEESDQYLPSYQLPEQVEKLLEMGKYENVENRVTKDNYKRRMHNLLYLEEYERRSCMSRYTCICTSCNLQIFRC